jgi:flagellar protein FliT
MGSQQVISHYESLCALTSQMHLAADRGEWDRLVVLEQQCTRLVECMKSADEEAELDEATRQQVVQLIRKTLADDNEIRSNAQNWMRQLKDIMQSNQQEQRLNRVYHGAK